MPVDRVERKLAAIFAADIAGYSQLMARDEVGTLARLKACRVIIDELIASHRGRIFNTAGDSVVADFASAVDAVQCAVAVQGAIAAEDAGGAPDEPMQYRIGVHVGDVMVDGDNLLGDGVNIAARLEALAEPGAICLSAVVRDQVGNKLPLAFDDLGDQQVKNIAQAIRVYRVHAGASAPLPVAALPLPDKPSIAVLPFQNISGDPEQEYFADGMVEEIITALSRIRWLFVIARNSTFTYKGQAIDVKQVSQQQGMRWRRFTRSDVNVKHRYARTGQQLASGAIDCVLPCLADAPAEIFKIGDGAAQCPERCVELFDPHENRQQRPGDRVERHLLIPFRCPLGPFGILTLPPPFALERRCARRTINLPGGLKPRGPELVRVVGIQLGHLSRRAYA